MFWIRIRFSFAPLPNLKWERLEINDEREMGLSNLYVSDPWHNAADILIKNLIWINH